MGVRVYQLAKELGFSSKELIEKLQGLHVDVKGHMSVLDEETTELIRHEIESTKTATPKIKSEKAAPDKIIKIKFPISVKDLAVKLQVSVNDLIKKLMSFKILANINQVLDEDTLNSIAAKLGVSFERELTEEEALISSHLKGEEKNLVLRSPVVTLMGHVDHGKTSLLDVIRKSKVADKESGGITQHIGAYKVGVLGKTITFLDTPGHEAFTAMRVRGANITDIVIIVVAADDGIMPQTIEAINHAKAANVSMVIAVNKMDAPGADIDNVRRQLAEMDLTCEEWGGKTIVVGVSAKKGTGIEHLLEMILLESEMLELRADPNRPAKGIIIESKLLKESGPAATVLVQNGTLRLGDVFVCGLTCGKIKAMINDRGERVQDAGPATPVEILGLSGVPQVGDTFYVVEDEKKAKEISQKKTETEREQKLIPTQRVSLDQLFQSAQEGQCKELKIILKADVQGSLEALCNSLKELATKDITVKIIHAQVGNINDSDIMLAVASNAVVIGFHVAIDNKAKDEAEKKNIDVRLYRIIYEVINDVRLSMEGLLEPTIKETFLGRAKVLEVFKISNYGTIAGCMIVKGKFIRTAELIRLFRAEQCMYEGKLSSLKRYKDDVKEVGEGLECGIGLDKFMAIQQDDIIECYQIEKIAGRL
ncbi:MAG: translation initiation factor IF-2 [Candidatus Omnitrophica bacterium]|nr:translation initiation factor IF-2 [Candidatus Omnitrophota bacterium]